MGRDPPSPAIVSPFSSQISLFNPSEPWKHGLAEVLRFTGPVSPYLLVTVPAFAQYML